MHIFLGMVLSRMADHLRAIRTFKSLVGPSDFDRDARSFVMAAILSAPLSATSMLTITDTPMRAVLHTWWSARHRDPDCAIAFSDDAPQDFAALCELIATHAYLFYLATDEGEDVVGAMWLHDLVRDADRIPRAGWLGTYVLPHHRGLRTTQAMWHLVREALVTRGVQSVYIASHQANTRAHRVAEQHLGFSRVGLFPAFARFQGTPTACVILSMSREDIGEAWAAAYQRAQSHRRHGGRDTVPTAQGLIVSID
jgi:RimJ/RimL family protein N-acetyltransferase